MLRDGRGATTDGLVLPFPTPCVRPPVRGVADRAERTPVPLEPGASETVTNAPAGPLALTAAIAALAVVVTAEPESVARFTVIAEPDTVTLNAALAVPGAT
jgi:hypothetical protein